MCDELFNKLCISLYDAENGHEIRGSQSEPIIRVLKGTLTEGFTVPETVITKIIFVKICVWSSDSS